MDAEPLTAGPLVLLCEKVMGGLGIGRYYLAYGVPFHFFQFVGGWRAFVINRRELIQYGEAAAVGLFGSAMIGCQKTGRNEPAVPSATGKATHPQPGAISPLATRSVRRDAKEFPHGGDDTTSWRNDTDNSKLYGLLSPTLTLVKETDTSGALTFYATMTWSYKSYGWSTNYIHATNTQPPDIAINLIDIDSAGHIGFLFRWDIGKVSLPCPPVPDAFFKTPIEPNLYDITMNWLPDFSEASFYRVC